MPNVRDKQLVGVKTRAREPKRHRQVLGQCQKPHAKTAPLKTRKHRNVLYQQKIAFRYGFDKGCQFAADIEQVKTMLPDRVRVVDLHRERFAARQLHPFGVGFAGEILNCTGICLTGDPEVVGARDLGIEGLDAAGVLSLVR